MKQQILLNIISGVSFGYWSSCLTYKWLVKFMFSVDFGILRKTIEAIFFLVWLGYKFQQSLINCHRSNRKYSWKSIWEETASKTVLGGANAWQLLLPVTPISSVTRKENDNVYTTSIEKRSGIRSLLTCLSEKYKIWSKNK